MQVNDSAGIGIEMVFQADTLPEGGLTGPTLIRDMEVLCKTWAQQVIAHVVAQTKMPPKFLSVMIRSGGTFGLYGRQRFSMVGRDSQPTANIV